MSFDRIVVHVVFSTKYRLPAIHEEIESELYGVMHSELEKAGCTVFAIGGTADHVHLVHSLPRTKSIARIIGAAKSVASVWLRNKAEKYRSFGWQDGYAVFSADYRKLDALIAYVRNQKQHHGINNTRLAFRKEYTTMLKAYGFTQINVEYTFPEPPTTVSEPFIAYTTPLGSTLRNKRYRWLHPQA